MFDADRSLGSSRWPVVRLVAGSSTEVTLLSTRWFCLTTHWSKCTFPCCGDGCRVCEILPSRGLFYAAVMCQSRVSILELGSQSSSYFEQHCKFTSGAMRAGLVLSLSRRGAKSPVRSEIVRETDRAAEVPHLDLATHVMALYKFPPPNPGDGLVEFEERCRTIAAIRCNRTADLLMAARERQINR